MADDLLPGAAGLAVSAQQRGRIDLETARRIGGDVARRHGGDNALRLPQQQPAAFVIACRVCLGQKGFADPACNFNDHPDIG